MSTSNKNQERDAVTARIDNLFEREGSVNREFPDKPSIHDLIYDELKNCSFIRELHVYGDIINHNDKLNKSTQHIGFGKKLLQVAEEISISNKVYKIAVISGVGVREYYKKQGYYLYKNYMFKNLYTYYWIKPVLIYLTVLILIIIIILY